MTPIDTAALRALADARDASGQSTTRLFNAELRALCDGYDEAARLRDEVEYADAVVLAAVDQRNAARQALAEAEAEAARLRARLVSMQRGAARWRPEREAARQAVADFGADLRALCDDKTGWDFIDPEDLRAVIDRHSPEGDA